LGINFFTSNVRDAIRLLQMLRPPRIELSSQQPALRDRLLARLYQLRDQQDDRAQALAELGGPETLLHGHLWTNNIFVLPAAARLQARLIDWDHAGVGSASYDLSTFLTCFPVPHRLWVLKLYREAVGLTGGRLPPARDLNLLFETASYARFANRLIWPAIALLEDGADWGFDALAEIERRFEDLPPVLSEETESPATTAVLQ
jgi:thiamine kinase-like enzyme